MPADYEPMLATLTRERFEDRDWIYERKLDGVRCVARRDPTGRVRLVSRTGREMTRTYPEIAIALADASSAEVVVDGEIVAFDPVDRRRTSFEQLQGRLGITDPDQALATGIAVYFYLFDCLSAGGTDLRRQPVLERKKALRSALTFTDPLRFTVHRRTGGLEMLRQACARGEEGVIAKRLGSAYTGGRSRDWLKFKCVRDQEFVIGGWTDPQGSRSRFGAILVGYFDGDDLVYAGKVGTGFDDGALRMLGDRFSRLTRPTSPFTRGHVVGRGVHWVAPDLVVQIGFGEWTRDGLLRHPRYQGLRHDKLATDVVRETG